VKVGRGPFDSYKNNETILFDEFRAEDWPITDMNSYCDKWPCELNCRFFNKNAYWTRVYICANRNPEEWWPNDGMLLREAFFRRITAIYEVTNKEELFVF